ncbi:hypothetical protein CLU79DRAFT_754387 [Phycomyces nitens]|nr:hypothetical protein CLU79DRAFT_754387 [Phycomyces nitens]
MLVPFALMVLSLSTLVKAGQASFSLDHSGLCKVPGIGEDCLDACSQINDMNGICVQGQCHCTTIGVGNCQDFNFEGCDSICLEKAPDLVGICFNGQCGCFS